MLLTCWQNIGKMFICLKIALTLVICFNINLCKIFVCRVRQTRNGRKNWHFFNFLHFWNIWKEKRTAQKKKKMLGSTFFALKFGPFWAFFWHVGNLSDVASHVDWLPSVTKYKIYIAKPTTVIPQLYCLQCQCKSQINFVYWTQKSKMADHLLHISWSTGLPLFWYIWYYCNSANAIIVYQSQQNYMSWCLQMILLAIF